MGKPNSGHACLDKLLTNLESVLPQSVDSGRSFQKERKAQTIFAVAPGLILLPAMERAMAISGRLSQSGRRQPESSFQGPRERSGITEVHFIGDLLDGHF